MSLVNQHGKLSRKAFLVTYTMILICKKKLDLVTESPHYMQSSTDYTTKDDFCRNSPWNRHTKQCKYSYFIIATSLLVEKDIQHQLLKRQILVNVIYTTEQDMLYLHPHHLYHLFWAVYKQLVLACCKRSLYIFITYRTFVIVSYVRNEVICATEKNNSYLSAFSVEKNTSK